MKLHNSRYVFVVCAVMLFFGGQSPVRAGLITALMVAVSPEPGNLNRYEYTLVNDATSVLPVFQLNVNVAADASLQSILGPTDWNIAYSAGDSQISWFSLSALTDLPTGQAAHFAFSSLLPPTSQDYLIIGIDETVGIIDTNQGTAIGPGDSSSAVPEPSALIIWLAGLALVCTFRCRYVNKCKISATYCQMPDFGPHTRHRLA